MKSVRDRAPLAKDWRATLDFLETMFGCCQNKKDVFTAVAGR